MPPANNSGSLRPQQQEVDMHHPLLSALAIALLGFLPICCSASTDGHGSHDEMELGDLVRYHIVGVYKSQTYIASDGSGQADIADRVVIDLSWKLSEAKLVGQPTFQNTKSTATNLRDREPSCLPPVLKGDYEHYDLLSVKNGLAGSIELQGRTTYPAVDVAQSCTASRKTVTGKVVARPEDFGVPSPVMFGMPLPPSNELAISRTRNRSSSGSRAGPGRSRRASTRRARGSREYRPTAGVAARTAREKASSL
jgi:hypothetical protein